VRRGLPGADDDSKRVISKPKCAGSRSRRSTCLTAIRNRG
jgi:hypothetical protein